MSSPWNHSVCNDCWDEMHPGRPACRLIDPLEERCCFCGATHKSGIYVRKNPADMECNGVHELGASHA